MRKAKVILNPAAGRGDAGSMAQPILAQLKRSGVEADLVQTRAPREAVSLAQRASADGFALVIAAGGDGTIHEVVNGLALAAGEGVAGTLGIIPIGSGNDFIKTAGIPRDWRAACSVIARGNATRFDIGRLDDRFFVNNAGIGFDAQVGIEAQSVRWARGMAIYVLALARNMLSSYRTPNVVIDVDDKTITQRVTLVNIGNGRCSGGGFWLTPNASYLDGLLDVCIADKLSRLGILSLIPHVMRGTHVDKKPIRMMRARTIRVTSDEPLPVQADGEILYKGAHTISFEIVPNKLNVCV